LESGQAAIKALNTGEADAVEAVSAYVCCVDEWVAGGDLVVQDEELGRLIADQHATILLLVESLKGQTASELKELWEKGKGLMAYTDVFPKRISTMRPKKG
jgi:hypothetical protein